MELKTEIQVLKKMKFGELEPKLQDEVLKFTREMEYECTVKASSNLHFLYQLYEAEKTKRKRNRKALKKAEDLILKIQIQHKSLAHKREKPSKKEEKRKRAKLELIEGAITINEKMRKIFQSLGISEEKVMVEAIETLGEEEIELRGGIIVETLGERAAKAIGKNPKILLEHDEDTFILEVETIANKKSMIDSSGITTEAVDYGRRPEILLLEFRKLSELLKLKPFGPESKLEKTKLPKYRGKPMDPDDFMRVLTEKLGFVLIRDGKHRILHNPETKATVNVQRAHKGNKELGRRVIKRKLMETGIDPKQFEKAREELKL